MPPQKRPCAGLKSWRSGGRIRGAVKRACSTKVSSSKQRELLRLPAVERLEVSDTARSLVDTSRVVVEESKQRKEEELRRGQGTGSRAATSR